MALHEKMMRDVHGETLIELAARDPRIVTVEADLSKSNGTMAFAEAYPDRAFNVGVAEANMVGVAAGLATMGFVPFCSSFTPFASRRVYDQAAISVAYAGANVKITGTDPGVTAEANGGTHMSFEDIALYRAMPRMCVLAPCDAYELRAVVRWAAAHEGPVYLQMLRKVMPPVFDETYAYRHGRAVTLQEGADVTLISTGLTTHLAKEATANLAGDGIRATHLHLPCLKPLDEEAVLRAAARTGAVVTCENGFVAGGLGGAVCELLSENRPTPVVRVGVRDRFGEVATKEYLLEKHGMTPRHIAEAARRALRAKNNPERRTA